MADDSYMKSARIDAAFRHAFAKVIEVGNREDLTEPEKAEIEKAKLILHEVLDLIEYRMRAEDQPITL